MGAGELLLAEDEIEKYLVNKTNGRRHIETLKKHSLKQHGADIDICGGKKNTERFLIECKKITL